MKVAWFVATLAALFAAVLPCAAQQRELGRQSHAWMHAVLEKTILRVDVARLDLCLDSATAWRISTLLQSRGRDSDDSIAQAVLGADAVLGRLHFLRAVGYGQFLGGIAEEQQNAVRAGLLDDSIHVAVRARLPEWFSFLENRDIHDGDEIVYHIAGDTVRTTYSDVGGTVLMERVDVGPPRRRSVLATWLAPGSGFRDDLMKSVRRAGDAATACRAGTGGDSGAGRQHEPLTAKPARGPRTPWIPEGRTGSS